MKNLLLGIFLVMISFAYADIYMAVDPHGSVTYTDEPIKNAQRIEVVTPTETKAETTTTTTEETTTVKTTTTEAGEEAHKPYTTFVIASPKDQETIQNDPNIIIQLTVLPDLQKGDKIQVFLDDTPVGPATSSTTVDIGRIERGTHRIRAALIDVNEKILKVTQTITIYAHYAHNGPMSVTPPPP